MWEDPIVAEVHRIREQLAAKFNYDIDAIFADMMSRQTALGNRLVAAPQRTVPTAEADKVSESDPAGSTPTEAAPAA